MSDADKRGNCSKCGFIHYGTRDTPYRNCIFSDEGINFMDKDQLKALRLRLNLTQTQMAEKLYITASAVAKIESGVNTMGRQTEALARALDMEQQSSPDPLLDNLPGAEV